MFLTVWVMCRKRVRGPRVVIPSAEALRLVEDDLSSADQAGLIEVIRAATRLVTLAEAARHRAAALFAELRADPDNTIGHEDFTASDLAAETGVSVRTAARQIATGEQLRELPLTMAAATEGRITSGHVWATYFGLLNYSTEAKARIEARALPYAETQTASSFKDTLRRIIHAEAADEVAAVMAARARRKGVGRHSDDDGISVLSVTGETERIAVAEAHVDACAKTIKSGGDDRDLAEIRADVALDLLRGDPHTATVTVHVLVPLSALTCRDRPAVLIDGSPFPVTGLAEMFTDYDIVFQRVLTDPATNIATDHKHNRYRVSDELRQVTRHRNPRCGFPGCNWSTLRAGTHSDHIVPFSQGGATDEANIDPKCAHHHRLKHEGKWRTEQIGPGLQRWISPYGTEFISEPEPLVHVPPPPPPVVQDEPAPF